MNPLLGNCLVHICPILTFSGMEGRLLGSGAMKYGIWSKRKENVNDKISFSLIDYKGCSCLYQFSFQNLVLKKTTRFKLALHPILIVSVIVVWCSIKGDLLVRHGLVPQQPTYNFGMKLSATVLETMQGFVILTKLHYCCRNTSCKCVMFEWEQFSYVNGSERWKYGSGLV